MPTLLRPALGVILDNGAYTWLAIALLAIFIIIYVIARRRQK